jgi:hypothetical protein
MSWSINTASPSRNRDLLAGAVAALCLAGTCYAQAGELRAPSSAVAGSSISIGTTGTGSATFYLVGPGVSSRRDVNLGGDIQIASSELRNAGKYLAIVCTGSCRSAQFFVTPAAPATLTFLVHPSRAPVGLNDVLSGVALPFDQFRNLVVQPTPVNFQLTAGSATVMSHQVSTQDGVAWFRAASGRSAGPLQVNALVTAAAGDSTRNASTANVSARRIVQQVAADPCNLRIKGQRTAKGIVVETDPVRDCAGNPVPDGTIVTFTARAGGDEKSTVDAPLKKGIARAQMTETGPVVVSAASGVVMGNELHLGAQ